jgi:hypothetical protein
MILRRFMKHVTDQNWFAVGLDVLVVITGIFLGMQVSEWNEGRKDRIDGQDFISRIHNEILDAEQASKRVRERRLYLISPLNDAAKTIFDKSKSRALTDEQCLALGTSHYLNIAVSDLPSLTELMSAGRVAIIEDYQLRTALIEHQQRLGTLKELIQVMSPSLHNLAILHPNLIKLDPYFDESLGEMQSSYKCDLKAMQSSQLFLNSVSENIDSYDAYLRDALRPWSKHMSLVHSMLDDALNIEHEIEKTSAE